MAARATVERTDQFEELRAQMRVAIEIARYERERAASATPLASATGATISA